MSDSNSVTVNEFVNVSDIRDIFLYTTDGYLFCYLRIFPFNLDLLSNQERKALATRIASEFDGDRKDFAYESFPRELDLDGYKNHLKQKRAECLEQLGRKNIIDAILYQAAELSGNHENFEHQHFYKIWTAAANGNKAAAEAELRERLHNLKAVYTDAQIGCAVMEEREIIKLCNLYSNRRSANYDIIGSKLQPEIPILRG